jgi:hypothetical protein
MLNNDVFVFDNSVHSTTCRTPISGHRMAASTAPSTSSLLSSGAPGTREDIRQRRSLHLVCPALEREGPRAAPIRGFVHRHGHGASRRPLRRLQGRIRPVQAQYEFARAYPDRVLFCGASTRFIRASRVCCKTWSARSARWARAPSSFTPCIWGKPGGPMTQSSPIRCMRRGASFESKCSNSTKCFQSAGTGLSGLLRSTKAMPFG